MISRLVSQWFRKRFAMVSRTQKKRFPSREAFAKHLRNRTGNIILFIYYIFIINIYYNSHIIQKQKYENA